MLKNKVYVKNKGITQDIFDAMVAVAKASGFKLDDQNEIGLNHYDLKYMLISKEHCAMVDCDDEWASNFCGEEISLEDWLFSLAPGWADRVEKWNDNFYYADEKNFCTLNSDTVTSKSNDDLVSPVETVVTRKQEQWMPKVGDECLVLNQELSNPELEKCRLLYIGNFVCVYNSVSCTERAAEIQNLDFKPLPKYTEQELLAYDVYRLLTRNNVVSIDDFLVDYNRSMHEGIERLVESGRFK